MRGSPSTPAQKVCGPWRHRVATRVCSMDCWNALPLTQRQLTDAMLPDILVTAPLPDFLYDPLNADYRCHNYVHSRDKSGLLAVEGAKIRGLVQGGGTV